MFFVNCLSCVSGPELYGLPSKKDHQRSLLNNHVFFHGFSE